MAHGPGGVGNPTPVLAHAVSGSRTVIAFVNENHYHLLTS